MKDSKYLREVKRTQNPDADCWEHYVLGLIDEVGEISKLFKKAVQSGDPGNVPKELLGEELGDLRYFLASLEDLYGLKAGKVKKANVEKLKVRYAAKKSYSAEEDVNRLTENEAKEVLIQLGLDEWPAG